MAEPTPHANSSNPSRDSLLETAKASPEIAGKHEKERWLGLFTDDAVLEDPVGGPASHRGRRPGRFGDEVGRFYEAFIAPSAIEMVTRRDIVSDMHVFRAVDIHPTNLKTGLQLTVPANLLYEIVPRGDGLAIRRMQAHWELNRMSRMLMAQGLRGARTIAGMNWSMLRAFGPGWVMQYVRASQRGVGRKGKELVERFASEVSGSGGEVSSPGMALELPGGAKPSEQEFVEGTASLVVEGLLASGRTVSGLATIDWGGRVRDAGFVAELDEGARRIERLRWFWEA